MLGAAVRPANNGADQRRVAVRTRSATALDLLCGGQAMTVVTTGASGTATTA